MKVLIVGGGGREHALAWAVARSEQVERVFVAPGNAGTEREPRVENVPLAPDFNALADFAIAEGIGLAIVGPEAPLAAGLRDCFDARGLPCFGPTAAAARLESSKAFAKAFLQRHGIPTARFEICDSFKAARRAIAEMGAPLVIKADGLAAGKGVTVARTLEEAETAARDMLSGARFGAAGRRVVVEEFLRGEEASFICVTDGERAVPLASSQDHKARDDGDRGPNTGGMGAYSPAPVVTAAVRKRVLAEVVAPTLRGMAAEGAPYQGFLYVGLMVTPDGAPKVIEYNCRLGDPEAQPLLMRLRDDLPALCLRALAGDLDGVALRWDERVALGVVMAAGGYPFAYSRGAAIAGLDALPPGVKAFHAGTASRDGETVTNGGRVLCLTALGDTVAEAQALAYRGVGCIDFADACYRTDIGWLAIRREKG